VRAVATKGQVEFYREINEGLEFAINPAYEPSSFEDLGSLYGIPKPAMPMANP